ncbi:coiled-coil domain-containing protein 83 isoform X2 [Salminus brasiliensis]|uniref:coiled-coil domain-containing protein 83 isoform X2 n=1 Tax=Salminus brasiliensis TaxID=930266 RepID=UPI003B83942F
MSKKKAQEDKMTPTEAQIQFQMQVSRKETGEFMEVITELEAENRTLTERLVHLREEQLCHIRELCEQAKEQEKKLEQREAVNKEQVEHAQQLDLELTHSQEEQLAELRRQLAGLKMQVKERQEERQVWLQYKNVERIKHQQQIEYLQSKLITTQKEFEKMSEKIKLSLDANFSEVDNKLIIEKKQLAIEALKQLDKSSCWEIKENSRLTEEVAIYRKEVSILDAAVRRQEEENLEDMKQLFDHPLNDLQILRNVFPTRASALEQMDSFSLEHNVQKLSLTETAEPRRGPLPQSDFRAEAGGAQHQQQAVKLEKDETDPSCKPSSLPCDLTMLLYGSQNDPGESLHLYPLEQKLLRVVGQAVTLHPLPDEPEDLDRVTHLDSLTQDRSLTSCIIRKKFP